jgi:hypothetical protein
MPPDADEQLFHSILGSAMIGLDIGATPSPEKCEANRQRHELARRQFDQGIKEMADLLKDSQRPQTSATDLRPEPPKRIEPHVSDADVWETIRALFIN